MVKIMMLGVMLLWRSTNVPNAIIRSQEKMLALAIVSSVVLHSIRNVRNVVEITMYHTHFAVIVATN